LSLEAEQVPPGSEGAVWLPYLTGERTPHGDANARAVLFGLTARHTRAHAVRAVMEGVAFALRDSLEIIRSLKIPVREIRLTGGGARSRVWRQIQADIFGREVTVLRGNEGPAFGAAVLAGVGVGVFDSCEAVHSMLGKGETVRPIPENVESYDRLYTVYRRLYGDLKPAYDAVARLTE
jgi:xylulokinase